ncbi:MAG: DNRLRE domain-containing protein [Planctomycetota bacterium]
MNLPLVLAGLVGAGLLSLTSVAAQQNFSLAAIEDAHSDQSQPTTNFGTSLELGFGKNFRSSPTFTTWFQRAYLRFDTQLIRNTGRWPTRVLLVWNQNRASAAGCLDVAIHRVTSAWSESSVTWQSMPTHDPAVIATACVGDSFSNGWKRADVTALVQAWLTGAVQDHGLVIKDPIESNAGAARPGFAHSRETGAATSPHLLVEFADRFGFGCSARALLPISDVTAGRPQLGSSFTFGTVGLISGSTFGVLFGTSNQSWSGGTLPWSLAPLGFPHCDLLVAPDIATNFGALASNSFDLVVPLPSINALEGASLYMQAVAVPPIPSLGLEVGNGVGVTLSR